MHELIGAVSWSTSLPTDPNATFTICPLLSQMMMVPEVIGALPNVTYAPVVTLVPAYERVITFDAWEKEDASVMAMRISPIKPIFIRSPF